MELEARGISISEEHGVIVVGFVDDEQAPSKYLLLQRKLDPDERDRKLGHDRVHLEVDGESRSGYVDVERAILSQQGLSLRLSRETATKLGVDEVIEIGLPSNDEQPSGLEASCRKVFDEKCFRLR